jgi:hypothetical protein
MVRGIMIKVLGLYTVFLLCNLAAWAQTTPLTPAELQRLKGFQSYVDVAQDNFNKLDGVKDSVIKIGKDEELNIFFTDVANREVNLFQKQINEEQKFNYFQRKDVIVSLESFVKVLRTQTYDWMKKRNKDFEPASVQELFNAFKEAAYLHANKQSIWPALDKAHYKHAEIIASLDILKNNVKENNLEGMVALKYSKKYPKELIKVLRKYPGAVPNADSLLIAAAKSNPSIFYTYMQDSSRKNTLMPLVRRSKDNLVKTISQIAVSNNGQKILPFIDNILKGKQTVAEIDQISGTTDSVAFYRFLVNNQIDYAKRMLKNDTPYLHHLLLEKLSEWSYKHFIIWINEMHDRPDAIRLRPSDNLTANEIYYLLTQNEEEIYTSSYRLLFDRMMSRAPGKRGDSLLLAVGLDRYKKFIKMAANYNRLTPFLASMPQPTAKGIMDAFVANLDKSIEEAVDVADAYSSIRDSLIKVNLRERIAKNFDLAKASNNEVGKRIYKLELDVMNGFENPNFDWKILGVSSPYKIETKELIDSNKGINILMFFYGDKDKDGQMSFANFIGTFKNTDWGIDDSNKEWVTLTHKKTVVPITIYANRPLYNEKVKPEPDATAQENLIKFLQTKNIEPKIVVHRGHSYHTQYTIEQMYSRPKLVFLGSCGGYKLLNQVMAKSDDVHIISTKQVGTKTVNDPMLRDLTTTNAQAKGINWPEMWLRLAAGPLKANKDFEDYIPPHKNLGALFLKAYDHSVNMGPQL